MTAYKYAHKYRIEPSPTYTNTWCVRQRQWYGRWKVIADCFENEKAAYFAVEVMELKLKEAIVVLPPHALTPAA